MKQYNKEGKLEAVICNRCKKRMKMEGEFLHADYLAVEKDWGYFSRRDGEVHRFDLCEECYDALLKELQIPAEVEEKAVLI